MLHVCMHNIVIACRVFIELLIDPHPVTPVPSPNQGEGTGDEPNIEAAPCSIFASSIVGEAPLAQNTSSLGTLWSRTPCPATSGGGEGGVEGRGRRRGW